MKLTPEGFFMFIKDKKALEIMDDAVYNRSRRQAAELNENDIYSVMKAEGWVFPGEASSFGFTEITIVFDDRTRVMDKKLKDTITYAVTQHDDYLVKLTLQKTDI